ncbi:hypothetical protein MAM1_0023c01917 [Mucor ambiguus]|uniref:Uncharacterized protein n=1 Tax=Mucor ambiguus TaxID=91626 RepID=A0A0C9MKT6_9FUNG|nr:hypothetical protein MAM1_0023c01917 [Mucor ambiguus]
MSNPYNEYIQYVYKLEEGLRDAMSLFFPVYCHSVMRLTTFFKAGMLPICAIIFSLAPFTTFSQPQTSFLAHTYNNASSSILISDTAYVDSSMMNANVPVANFYMLGENGNSTILYHLDPVNLREDQAISSLGIQAKPKSWMLPKEVWVETKEEENDAIWDIVTRKENGNV